MRPTLVATTVGLAVTALLAGCSSAGSSSRGAASDDRPTVVAAFYPLAYAAERVGGAAVQVTSLTPPGVEPHDLELSAAQVGQIAEADLVLYVKGFQPAVDEAVEQQAADRAVDVAASLDQLPGDPHVWLDPANMATIAEGIAERITALSPGSAISVDRNATDVQREMSDLDAQYADALATCASRDLVVSHEAFGYLAKAYGLTQVGISGLSPEAEPSPARVKEVAELVRANGISTIYYETLVDPKVARTIADETGATTAVLDPLEGLAPGSEGDYASIMTGNLATLVAGQSCS